MHFVRNCDKMAVMMRMRTKQITANESRFPEPSAGEAIVVSKYADGRRKAVILHPTDFDLFEHYRRIFAQQEPYEMRISATALAAHELGERGADETALDLDSLDLAL
jgi:hypothetical protein